MIPAKIWLGIVFLLCCALVPAAIVLNMRASRSDQPRWHVFFDMDFQPKRKAQQPTKVFADGRVSRPQVVGTVARGQLSTVDPFYLGYDPNAVAMNADQGSRLVALQDTSADSQESAPSEPAAPTADATPAENAAESTEGTIEPQKADGTAQEDVSNNENPPKTIAGAENPNVSTEPSTNNDELADGANPNQPQQPAADGATPPPAADPVASLPFLKSIPLEATPENMKLGKQKFETYCSACHGYAGSGDGLASLRATALNQGDWLQPTSLHDPKVVEQPVGQVFYTITHGKGKMGSYGGVTSPAERWAIVMYVEALQRAKNAKIDDVPRDLRGSIKGPESK